MFDTQTILLGAAVFTLAGLVKGLIGLGLPTVSLALLGVFLDLRAAIALMIVPSVITNIWQAVDGGKLIPLTIRLAPMLFAGVITTWFASAFLLNAIDPGLLSAAFGVLLALYSAYGLLTPDIPRPGKWEPVTGPVVGVLAGTATGLTGSFVVPGVPYLQSLRLSRDELVQAMGICFTVVLAALGGGLAQTNLMTVDIGLWSLAGLAPASAGMWAGRKIRRRIPELAFRKVFFCALLILGAYLAIRQFV